MPHRKLRDIVAGQSLLSVEPDTVVADAVKAMQARRFSCVPVIEDGELLGVFTSSNLVQRVLDAGLDPAATRIADVMSAEPYCLGCDCQGIEAVQFMRDKHIHHLIVTDGGKTVVGVVTRHDFPDSEIEEIEDELEFEQRLWEEL